jgi:hypothetical protein
LLAEVITQPIGIFTSVLVASGLVTTRAGSTASTTAATSASAWAILALTFSVRVAVTDAILSLALGSVVLVSLVLGSSWNAGLTDGTIEKATI